MPYFKPFLFDVLAEDIFAQLGTLTTLEAFNDDRGDNREVGVRARIRSISCASFLQASASVPPSSSRCERRRAGGVSLQRELVRPSGRAVWPGISHLSAPTFDPGRRKLRVAFNSATPGSPRRLPSKCPEQNERGRPTNRCFRPEPWIPPPPGLVAEPPAQPGEVRFARGVFRRRGAVILFVPLTRDEAEEKHRTRQDYALARRAGRTRICSWCVT